VVLLYVQPRARRGGAHALHWVSLARRLKKRSHCVRGGAWIAREYLLLHGLFRVQSRMQKTSLLHIADATLQECNDAALHLASLNTAILLLKHVVHALSVERKELPGCLRLLAEALLQRFSWMHQLGDLYRACECCQWRAALAEEGATHPRNSDLSDISTLVVGSIEVSHSIIVGMQKKTLGCSELYRRTICSAG